MAIQLSVVLKDGHTYNYWKLRETKFQRGDAEDPADVTLELVYDLHKDSTAFGTGSTRGGCIGVTLAGFDFSAIGVTSDAIETAIDDAVIADAQALTIAGVAFNTSTGSQVA